VRGLIIWILVFNFDIVLSGITLYTYKVVPWLTAKECSLCDNYIYIKPNSLKELLTLSEKPSSPLGFNSVRVGVPKSLAFWVVVCRLLSLFSNIVFFFNLRFFLITALISSNFSWQNCLTISKGANRSSESKKDNINTMTKRNRAKGYLYIMLCHSLVEIF